MAKCTAFFKERDSKEAIFSSCLPIDSLFLLNETFDSDSDLNKPR
jgi:hypothetical protein